MINFLLLQVQPFLLDGLVFCFLFRLFLFCFFFPAKKKNFSRFENRYNVTGPKNKTGVKSTGKARF